MYFTPRGKDQREQRILDWATAQKFLETVVSGKGIEDFFQRAHMSHIAIVPFNHFGKCLARQLKGTGVTITCFADQKYAKFADGYCGIPVEPYESSRLKAAEAVVVTSNYYFNDIADILTENGISLEKIIGINTILFGMERLERT